MSSRYKVLENWGSHHLTFKPKFGFYDRTSRQRRGCRSPTSSIYCKMYLSTIIKKALNSNISIKLNSLEEINNGLVVLYPLWSKDQRFFQTLLNELNEWELELSIYIFDIDSPSCRIFESKHAVLGQGKCEMYLIRNGKIVFKIEHHNSEYPGLNIREMLLLVSN